MCEYVELNHMSKVVEGAGASGSVYLPHHGIFRESSITTRLRVVFDRASAKTTSGVSLNDTLMVEANLQDNVINIILRFRLPAIAITTDLQKMYRQVVVHRDDRDCQRILWRFSPDDPVEEYRLNTVTYGMSCAPFLAIRSVHHLAKEGARRTGRTAQVLLSELYVDYVLTEADASELISQLKLLLREGGFETHKWRSNCKEILSELRAADRIEESSALGIDADVTRMLGLNWYPESDMFQFSIEPIMSSVSIKREVLSTISRLFDLLRLVGPILTRTKLIMQET